jgi:hypothetical protein
MNKKLLALLLALVLALGALTACGQTDTADDASDATVDTDVVTDDETTEPSDEDETPVDTDEPSEEETPEAPIEDAEAPTEADSSSLEAVIDAIYAVEDPILGSLATIPVDLDDADSLAYYTGLTDNSKLVEVAVSEPMIGSQAYSLVVARVADEADAESVARDIMDNIDTAKWICVSADDTAAAYSGDLALFVMVDEYNEELSARPFVDAFLSIYGGTAVE